MNKPVNEDQAWFWTRRWQEGEKRADEDIRAGRVHSFPSPKEAIAYLHGRVEMAKRVRVDRNTDSSREERQR